MTPKAPPQTITLRDSEGKRLGARLLIPDTTPIGSGTRANVYKVLLRTESPNPGMEAQDEYMAMKVYKGAKPEMHAENTMHGHGVLSMSLPESEKSRLTNVYTDEKGRVFMPLLNTDSWVVSMGGNDSQDREELKKEKLHSIPNFNVILSQLLDAVEDMGRKSVPMGADLYLLTVHRQTHALDYAYTDMEAVHADLRESPEQIVLRNFYWVAGAFNHFLHECVQEPTLYLARVRLEVISRMMHIATSQMSGA
jgi:hypothetical protein